MEPRKLIETTRTIRRFDETGAIAATVREELLKLLLLGEIILR